MNYYEILEVKNDATEADIKKAYRKLAMKHHPDRNQGKKTSEDQFKKINEAYATLSDKDKRSNYDYTLNNKPFNNSSFNHNSSNFEEEFANAFFRQEASFDDIFRNFSKKQNQQILKIPLNFWEAAFGVDKIFEFNVKTKSKNEKSQVKISFPPGTNTDDSFNVIVGNHTIEIKVEVGSNERFRRDNLDLYTDIDIPMTTALLGGTINFVHWEKTLEINIPAGIKQNQTVRLANLGIKKDMFVGDLYFMCNIVLPKKLNKKQKELLHEFSLLEEKQNKTTGENLKNIWNKFFNKTAF